MQKTYCDKCGNEIHGKPWNLHIEFVGEHIYTFKHLCDSCFPEFTKHLYGFMPSFFGDSFTLADTLEKVKR